MLSDNKQKTFSKKNINWFPGHMNKARRVIEENVKCVDIVLEIRDARIVESSFNPLLNEITKNKRRLIILNKKDLADDDITKKWLEYFKSKDIHALAIDCVNQQIDKIVVNKIKEICEDILLRAKNRGVLNKTLKVMVLGIPNVGKSTFINKIIKKSVTRVENRPGVTKNINWIRIHKDVDLLDTPGVLWPSFEKEEIGINLSLVGSINDTILDKEFLVDKVLDFLLENYPKELVNRYSIKTLEDKSEILKEIAINKKLYISNERIDYVRLYDLIISDIRRNQLGRISFEKP